MSAAEDGARSVISGFSHANGGQFDDVITTDGLGVVANRIKTLGGDDIVVARIDEFGELDGPGGPGGPGDPGGPGGGPEEPEEEPGGDGEEPGGGQEPFSPGLLADMINGGDGGEVTGDTLQYSQVLNARYGELGGRDAIAFGTSFATDIAFGFERLVGRDPGGDPNASMSSIDFAAYTQSIVYDGNNPGMVTVGDGTLELVNFDRVLVVRGMTHLPQARTSMSSLATPEMTS